ncbi:hypothetical protein TOPH_02784 [Tolypocladium ophioglossoides CBS 100239]|uniref:Glycosyl hydrolase family 95 N-terminal domain-containing protein n=1 Tax=Tolypocladium ophioglossoides (strain CBS 100239) TaxID=1163406 RepID=A0A0L0NG65_TOLOC|nr:hypothetical protein TOPH_02784 [Tolypocladium ophioglossoides CBS 100239]
MKHLVLNGALGWLITRAVAAFDVAETGALPKGNSRLGATIIDSDNEAITINEDTIRSGPSQQRIPTIGLESLPKARELLLGGTSLRPPVERASSYFSNLSLKFGHGNAIEDHVRWIDTVSYTYNGVNFTRECIAFPHRCSCGAIHGQCERRFKLKRRFRPRKGHIFQCCVHKEPTQ